MAVNRYNAKDLTVMIGQQYITGLGEDMVSWAKDEAYAETSVGAQGDVVKSEINNDLHTLTLTVQSTSPQVAYLVGLAKSNEFFPITCVNKSLGLSFGGTKCWVSEAPEISLGASAEDLEFSFTVADGYTDAE